MLANFRLTGGAGFRATAQGDLHARVVRVSKIGAQSDMIRRRCNELLLAIVLIALLPLSVTQVERRNASWPVLLAGGHAGSDPDFAALQNRAHASLERILRPDNLVE
jgi:hypothetical protein